MIEYTVKVYSDHTEWYLNGNLHREDRPAIEWANGTKEWYLNGNLHREDGPAIEYSTGDKYWFLNGKRHREDGPAVECANGTKQWFLFGYQQAAVEFNARKKQTCIDKIIEIDGVKYKLQPV